MQREVLNATDAIWRTTWEIASRAGLDGIERQQKAYRALVRLRDKGHVRHNGRMGPWSRWARTYAEQV